MFNKLFTLLLVVLVSAQVSFAEDKHEKSEKFNIGEMIMHHIKDSHDWHFATIGETHLTLPLPVILYTKDRGIEIFSSSHFHHGTHNGYINEHEHIKRVDAAGNIDETVKVWDFSITKNVASLLLSFVILMLVFTSVASAYKKNPNKAPKGLQSFLEPIIVLIRDEIVKPNIGPKYERYLPYMLTLFFFIFLNNLLGLLPGGANLTGNIAVTMTLAVLTFLITNLGSNKNYWAHLWQPTGVPGWLIPLMLPVEIMGVFIKPFSLMMRLFANITGGHIVLLTLIGLTFMFKSWAVGFGSSLFALFISCIELVVAFIQAVIFTLLSSMYIGASIEEHHHEAEHH